MNKRFYILFALVFLAGLAPASQSKAEVLASKFKGRILLQVESRGEAWYVRSKDLKRYYMKDGAAAYAIMRFFSQGITDDNLAKIPQVSNTSEMKAAASACTASPLGNRFRGEILLQVQQHGEAWYVDPVKCRAIYMKDGAVAYEVMRFLGFGVFTRDLETIPDGGAVPGADSGAASPPASQPPSAPSAPDLSCASPTDSSHMDIFDSHAHMPPEVSASMMISEMDKGGVSVANLYTSSDNSLAAISQYPGRFITFVDTPDNPKPSTWLTQGQAFVASAEQQLKTGKYYGIGEANLRYYSQPTPPVPPPDIYVPPDNSIWLQLVDLAAKYHVPISFHFVPDDATANAAFERMLNHNSNATLIWAHLGFNNMPLDRATLNDYLLRYPACILTRPGFRACSRPARIGNVSCRTASWTRTGNNSLRRGIPASWSLRMREGAKTVWGDGRTIRVRSPMTPQSTPSDTGGLSRRTWIPTPRATS